MQLPTLSLAVNHPRKILESLGIHPKKQFGQNFLLNQPTIMRIIDFANIAPDSIIVEIGPGIGALTQELVKFPNQVVAIEKDPALFQFLKDHYKAFKNFSISLADAITFDFSNIGRDRSSLQVISNLPYSVSTPILENLLKQRNLIKSMSLMFQNELVERICAPSGSKTYGRISILCQLLCDVKKGPKISKNNFWPKPEIESRLVHFEQKNNVSLETSEIQTFLDFVKAIFSSRRKTLRNNLLDHQFDLSEIDEQLLKLRPEELSVNDLIKFYKAVFHK